MPASPKRTVTGLDVVSPLAGEMMYSLASAGRGVRGIGWADAAACAAAECESTCSGSSARAADTISSAAKHSAAVDADDASLTRGSMGSPSSGETSEPTRSRGLDQTSRAGRCTGFAIAAALLLLFAALVALRVHGFSIAAWHAVIDGSAPEGVLFGAARPIRSDDWKVQIPLILSQQVASPAFPIVNPMIGGGQNMFLPIEVPIAHWSIVFRPTMWGWFLGPDVGLAWQWWSRALGLFGTWLAVLCVVARGRMGIAAAGSALLVASPFFQFWALNAAPHAICAGAVVLASIALARARTPRGIAAAACALAFSGAWFTLTLYPPYQVTLGWLVIALVAGMLLDARTTLPLGQHRALRSGALVAAGVVAIAIVAVFAWDAHDAIEIIRNTVYPGRRLSTGADRSVAELLNANLGAPLWATSWGSLHNICEAASFWLLSPALIALTLWRRARGERIDALTAAVALYAAVLWIYIVLGFPAWLARATALGSVPGRRAVIGLGIADVILLVRFAACAVPIRPGERVRAAVLAIGWGGLVAASGAALARVLPDARAPVLAAFAFGNALLVAAFLLGPRVALPLLAVISAASSLWFNPVAVGGTAFLRENALAREIVAIDRAAGGESVWVSFGRDDLPNLFRTLGVRSLAGAHPLPPLALWERIDPGRRQRNVYDRYAHVTFVATPGGVPTFQLHSQDFVILRIDPRSAAFRALGATHVLVRDPDTVPFEKFTGWKPLAVVGQDHLYRVPE